jgi:HK97 gp10 family phage protein
MKVGSVVWEDDKVLKAIEAEAERVEKLGAHMVQGAAKSMVGKKTGNLHRQIVVQKSKWPGGGYLVYAQPPGTPTDEFYAAYVEYGHAKPYQGRESIAKARGISVYAVRKAGLVVKHIPAHPFMRPAMNKYRKVIQAMWRRQLT